MTYFKTDHINKGKYHWRYKFINKQNNYVECFNGYTGKTIYYRIGLSLYKRVK